LRRQPVCFLAVKISLPLEICDPGQHCGQHSNHDQQRAEAVSHLWIIVLHEERRMLDMKTLTKELWMEIPKRRAVVSLHREVERLVQESEVTDGLVLINAMHITASVFINDNESGLHHDYEVWLENLAPFDPSPQRYHHNRTGEDNADAHLKRQIMGREVVVAITDGKLHLGPWEHIFYFEFDGNRRKRVLVKIIGE
jgi:secondary thiamine-phosphate synthase enzyme